MRFDAGREALIYDAFEYLPTPLAAFEMDSRQGDPVTPSELDQIEQLLKKHYKETFLFLWDRRMMSFEQKVPMPSVVESMVLHCSPGGASIQEFPSPNGFDFLCHLRRPTANPELFQAT